MKLIPLTVPKYVRHISEWAELDAMLPPDKIIVDKVLCGSGMTYHYLTNDMPVILASPRRALIDSKMDDDDINKNLHYFDRSDPHKVTLVESIEKLSKYLFRCRFYNLTPKILCTYDSLPSVIKCADQSNWLDEFVLVGDEATCIFTDARMKGSESIKLLELIDSLENRCIFISATHLKNVYLDEVPVFKDMPYVRFEWDPSREQKVYFKRNKMTSTVGAICGIIDTYRANGGYFEAKIIDGQQVKSTEAAFFLNSVDDIVKIVKKEGLTANDTRVICADNSENRAALKKVGLTIGRFPAKNRYKKMYKANTFITRSSFEGADYYSDNASIYVFADSNRETLSLDISIDLPQIIGRCRTKENPFRNEIHYYYKTTDAERFNLQEAKAEIQAKIDRTEQFIQENNGKVGPISMEKYKAAQEHLKYTQDYADVICDDKGNMRLEKNSLVILADFRALEIKHQQYTSNYSVFSYLKDNGYDVDDYRKYKYGPYHQFFVDFENAGNFEDKMKIYAQGCDDPQIRLLAESETSIPLHIKNYYNILGPERCRALNYKEAAIKRELEFIGSKEIIRNRLMQFLKPNTPYRNADLKTIIQQIYAELGISKKATATDLTDYFENVKAVKVNNSDGTRDNGLMIIN